MFTIDHAVSHVPILHGMALHMLQQPVSLSRLLSCHVPPMAFEMSAIDMYHPVTPTYQVFPRCIQCDKRHPTRDASKLPRPLHLLTSAITEPLNKGTSSHLISPSPITIMSFCRMGISLGPEC
jgi:hypothetical protein